MNLTESRKANWAYNGAMGVMIAPFVGLCVVAGLAVNNKISNAQYNALKTEEQAIETTIDNINNYFSENIRPQAQKDLEGALHRIQSNDAYQTWQEDEQNYKTLLGYFCNGGLVSVPLGMAFGLYGAYLSDQERKKRIEEDKKERDQLFRWVDKNCP